MAKNKRPFSTFLENPEAKKAVQEALHAPAQLPAQESPSETPVSDITPVLQPPASVEPELTEKTEEIKPEPYQVVTIRKSIHRLLKMASVHYGIEIREIASEAIANDPKVRHMLELMEKK